jgi:hypothetical protein
MLGGFGKNGVFRRVIDAFRNDRTVNTDVGPFLIWRSKNNPQHQLRLTVDTDGNFQLERWLNGALIQTGITVKGSDDVRVNGLFKAPLNAADKFMLSAMRGDTISGADTLGDVVYYGVDASNGGWRCDVYKAGVLVEGFTISPEQVLSGPGMSGTYTPTLTNGANVAASTPRLARWARLGNVVTVFGQLEIDPTLAATVTYIDISLPVASSFSSGYQGAGVAAALALSLSGSVGAVNGSTVVRLAFVSTADVANNAWSYSFSYDVV